MMKTIKTALFATAAIAAVSTVAHADALADLKSMIEKLSTRDAAYQAGVQVPAGFRVNPTADQSAAVDAVDEPFVDVKVSGYIKSGFIYSQVKTNGDDKTDFDVEGGVNVKGSVQSPLGEVGTTIQLKYGINPSTNNSAKGVEFRDEGLLAFWQFADSLKLEMGRGNGGRLENGIDKNTRRILTVQNRRIRAENAGNGFFDRDMYNGFMGLTYASGPITLQTRVHDATRGIGTGLNADDDAIGVSAKAVYSGDVVGFEASGGYWGEDGAANLARAQQTGVKYLIGAGTELNFIQGVPVSFAAQYGELHNGTQSLKLSGSFGVTITDTIGAGFGGGWTRISNTPAGGPLTTPNNTTGDHEELAAVGGIYYSPMSYLTLGLEGDWVDDSRPTISDGFTGAVVTRVAF
jgi:hypothetical protein